ncbi:MAG: TlpA family protein disulfide reductase [Cyclobacteriaceae bacterium]|nr:TlpA family protein disulfide reductase [Cyclobacteriaceae bacterium]
MYWFSRNFNIHLLLVAIAVVLVSCNGKQKQSGEKGDSEGNFTSNSLEVGSIAPGFSLPNPSGKMVSLSDFRGKYLYLDFWASWCQPCRQENPALVAAYRQFHSPTFEMLGVSFDKNKDKWLNAIEEDGLPWEQVSDLKYFDSDLIEKYQIQAIPFSLLLDPDGKILAKNIRASELESLLSNLNL